LNQVKSQTDKIKQDLNELLQSTWNSQISEIKQKMKNVEAERKKQPDSTKDKEYKTKMDDLSRQLDQQQREKQRKEDSI